MNAIPPPGEISINAAATATDAQTAARTPRRYGLGGVLVADCLGFIIPAIELVIWSIERAKLDSAKLLATTQYLWLGLMAAAITVLPALHGYGRRRHPTRPLRAAVSLAGWVSATPGIVIAGLLSPLT